VRVVVRALLTATAAVVAVFPALVVAGGFIPDLPTIGRFGAFLNTDLPWIALAAFAATAIAWAARRLGAGRFATVILAATLAVSGGAVAIAIVFVAFAAQHGAEFSIVRQASPAVPTGSADERVEFGLVGGVALRADVWLPPADAPGAAPGGRTAVVYVHGGAFAAGGLGMRPQLFESLADRGTVVIDVEYRLTPPPRWADAPADVLCALAWLRGAAGGLGVDPARVVVMGESAGGSLALVAGYSAGSDLLAPSCAGEPLVPAGIIAIAPAADLAGIWADRTLVVDGRPFPEAYIGGTPAEYPDRYDAAEPYRLIREGLPRTLIVTGANDHLVLPMRVTSLADRLIAGGVDCRLVVVPFADHGFDGPPNGFGAEVLGTILPAFIDDIA
jgi:acetyl esterase/lipase